MRKHLGKARYPALIVLAAVAILLFARLQLAERSRAHASVLPLLPTSTELADALIRSGLDAEALAAAGLSAADVGTVASNVYTHLIETHLQLELADASVADARGQTADLKRIIQSGRATDEQVNAYPVATAALAQAGTECESLLGGIFDAGAADLGENQRAALAAIRANRGWKLPIEFLVVDRTEAQWVELRDCLANERIAAGLEDEDPDAQAQTTLAQLRADPQVAVAMANRDAALGVVTDAWEEACGM